MRKYELFLNRLKPRIALLGICSACVCFSTVGRAAAPEVTFSASPVEVEAYDYAEITATIANPNVTNPFEDAAFTGTLETQDGSRRWNIDGFNDSLDGSVFRIRLMPPYPGEYKYSLRYRQAGLEKTVSGTLRAIDGHRSGLIQVDPKYPWHFLWSGSGKHYFFNGTTAFWLAGWRDDHVIDFSIDRLHRLKVNRIRVALAGREGSFFGEPVVVGSNWTLYLTPWPAVKPDDYTHPGFDYSRFDIAYWQKYERMLRHAREQDMVISVVLDMNDSLIHPVAGSEDEYRFIRYAVARFGAFSNITWDLGDDLERYRDDRWTHETGTLLQQWDPYKHLETSHPTKNEHQDRASAWFGFTSYQDWSRDQHRLMLDSRTLQERSGRIIPQTNEEYGYEDHYPSWALPDSDSSDVLRRTAWEIVMAGGYQTAGETARRGTNIGADSGGGWMNGRGDDTMTMFLGYGHMVDFFTGFDWWKTNPHDQLVSSGAYCLADPGNLYAIYLPHAGNVTVQLLPGRYDAYWFSASTGEKIDLPAVVGGDTWKSPDAPDRYDWALLLKAQTH